jgi:uncharacterized Zn-finger protein
MKTNNNDIFCEGCGATLTNFLREMADHNAQVVCPHCGKVYGQGDVAALTKKQASIPPSGKH